MASKESLELRAEKWLSEVRYESAVGRGNRGLMPHHIAQLKGPLADLLDEAIREARREAIEQCAIEAGERSPEGVSSHTMLGDMWDARLAHLREGKT